MTATKILFENWILGSKFESFKENDFKENIKLCTCINIKATLQKLLGVALNVWWISLKYKKKKTHGWHALWFSLRHLNSTAGDGSHRTLAAAGHSAVARIKTAKREKRLMHLKSWSLPVCALFLKTSNNTYVFPFCI